LSDTDSRLLAQGFDIVSQIEEDGTVKMVAYKEKLITSQN
jgi:hypothetical protein